MEKERLRGSVTFSVFVDEAYWPQIAGLCADARWGYECDLRLRILSTLGNMEIEQIYN